MTVEEVQKMEILYLDESSYTFHARNLWLFSFYLAGMRVSDILRLKWSDIQDNRLAYSMGKNSKTKSLKLSDKAIRILGFYKTSKKVLGEFIFPELKDVDSDDTFETQRKISYAVKRIEQHLEKVREKMKLEKKLTMHIARHSFGKISGDKISIQMLQKLYAFISYYNDWISREFYS